MKDYDFVIFLVWFFGYDVVVIWFMIKMVFVFLLQKFCVFDKLSDVVGWMFFVCFGFIVVLYDQMVFVKFEYFNFMGLSKDCFVCFLIDEVLENGCIVEGSIVIEVLLGNMVMGFVMMVVQEGLCFCVVVWCQMSFEKFDCLCVFGVELEFVDGELLVEDEVSYNCCVEFLFDEIDGVYFFDQYNNWFNNLVYYISIGLEIWEQMEGCIDVVVVGIGIGGMFLGVVWYFKE